jgi:preprotein translocase subunit SecF
MMVVRDRRLWISVAVALVAISGSLSGCALVPSADSSGGSVSTLTLTETKSPAQLLRNVAASRLPTNDITVLTDSEDVSVACGKDKSIRSWRSAVIAGVDVAHQPTMNGVADDLVKTFTDQGWQAKAADTKTDHVMKLTKNGSETVIEVSAVPANTFLNQQHGAQIQITVTGPCVQTDGPDSAEVRTLEGR